MWGDKARRIKVLQKQVADLSHNRQAFAGMATQRLELADTALNKADEFEAKLVAANDQVQYLTGLTHRLMEALGWFVVVPDDVSTMDIPADSTTIEPTCPTCPHTRGRHDGWGCSSCTCQVAAVHIRTPVAHV